MTKCIICNSKKIINFPGVMTQFLIHRMEIIEKSAHLNKCANCSFAFFDYRPSDLEMQKLYLNYRDKDYQKIRQIYEPFYTKEFNSSLGSEEEVQEKRLNLLNVLKKAKIDYCFINNILDYGGDRGQNIDIPEFLNANKYIYDIAGIEVISSIKNVANFSNEEKKEKFDLVVSQHTLEHISYPVSSMKEIHYMLKKGGYFYFELPQDDPTASYFSKRRMIASYFFKKYRKYLTKLFFYKKLPVFMHEHINYFDKKSVKFLCKKSGLKLLECFDGNLRGGRVICGLALKK